MIRPSWLLALFTLFLALPVQAAFTDNGDGTVTDTVTGLIWDQCSWGLSDASCATGAATLHTWAQALGVAVSANNANYKSHNDWRLPNLNELESLVKIDVFSPAIDTTAFPNTVSDRYWSSTNYVPVLANVWLVIFYEGLTDAVNKGNVSYVRLVRSGQLFDSFDAQGDFVPDAFSFTAQTGAALSTLTASNTITVAGMTTVSSISIVGGSYAINGGAYTTAAGSVSNGDTVTLQQTSSGSYSTLTTATLTIGGVAGAFNVTTLAAPKAPVPTPAPTPAPTGPIPSLGSQPYVPGISNQPGVLNLSGGDGPAMLNCLMVTLGQALGGNPVYQGQNANGAALVSWGGQLIVFYPLSASTGGGQGAGVYLQNGNALNVVTSCGAFSVSPALADLAGIGAILNNMGLNANINAQGVITVWVNGTYYVVRPDYLVTPGTPGTPGLVMGADGLFHYTDSNGNSQILRPAFLDTDTLQNQLILALGGGSMVIQTDGTALLSYGGHQYVLIPDLTLGSVPQAHASDYWWQDGPNHYSFRIGVYPYYALSQGFTVR